MSETSFVQDNVQHAVHPLLISYQFVCMRLCLCMGSEKKQIFLSFLLYATRREMYIHICVYAPERIKG